MGKPTGYVTKSPLGPNLLVAPVFVPVEEETEYYLPAGRWTSFFHPERTVQGPMWIKEMVPLDEIPVWVRPGSILCLGPENTGRPDYDYTKGLEVRIYELDDGQTAQAKIPVGRGAENAGVLRARREGSVIRLGVLEGDLELSAALVLGSGGSKASGNVVTEISLEKDEWDILIKIE